MFNSHGSLLRQVLGRSYRGSDGSDVWILIGVLRVSGFGATDLVERGKELCLTVFRGRYVQFGYLSL